MNARFRIAYTFSRQLEDLGISPEVVLRRARLPRALFEQPQIMVTTQELFALYAAVEASSSEPAIGLRLGSEMQPERYDPLVIAGLCSRNFEDAIQRIARFKRLVCPEDLLITERGHEREVRFAWTDAHEDEPAVLVDQCFSWLLSIGQRGLEEVISPSRVEFRRPAPTDEEEARYRAFFGCPVLYEREEDVLVFASEVLSKPFVSYNPDLLGLLAPKLEEELGQCLEQKPLDEKVKIIMKQQLAGEQPTLEQVARELCVSSRSLQRKLNEGGFESFQNLLSRARAELALHYLEHTTLEFKEIAYLLGYKDANSFYRAFREWEGTSPGAWREENATSDASHAVGA
jgi:AraC-like DNA-binding protein